MIGDGQLLTDILDIGAGVFLVLGGVLSLAAGVGLIRFPDAVSRLHAATKPQILGLIFVVIALALSVRSGAALLLLIPVVIFQMLTAPISAHMVGRAGYRTGDIDADTLVSDELAADIASAGRGDLRGGAEEYPGDDPIDELGDGTGDGPIDSSSEGPRTT